MALTDDINHLAEQLALSVERGSTREDPFRRENASDVLLQGEDRFGLGAIAFQDDRLRLGDVGERLVDHLFLHAAGNRLRAHAGEPFGKRRPRRFLSEGEGSEQRDQHDRSVRYPEEKTAENAKIARINVPQRPTHRSWAAS